MLGARPGGQRAWEVGEPAAPVSGWRASRPRKAWKCPQKELNGVLRDVDRGPVRRSEEVRAGWGAAKRGCCGLGGEGNRRVCRV